MAFLKFASFNPKIEFLDHLDDWNQLKATTDKQAVVEINKISGLENFKLSDYLVTHCTIIASVDVEPKKNYYITPKTAKYINDNHDSWERKLLANTYKTFIGAWNALEHIQIFPEMAKGRILDAALRDVGDAYYVDILVATDKRHKELCRKIESGELNGLSMGCSVKYTICSRCGKLAHDETELCQHIKYEKGNTFIDEDGVQRITAELCGQENDPSSVVFIEASWVQVPAFKGAVKNKILTITPQLEKQAKEIFGFEPKTQAQILKAASSIHPMRDCIVIYQDNKVASVLDLQQVQKVYPAILNTDFHSYLISPVNELKNGAFNRFSEDEPKAEGNPEAVDPSIDEEKAPPEEEPEEKSNDPKYIDQEKKAPELILDEDHMEESVVKATLSKKVASSLGFNKIPIQKLASVLKKIETIGWEKAAKESDLTDREILLASALYEIKNGTEVNPDLYSLINKLGNIKRYPNESAFLRMAISKLGRSISESEKVFLLRKAKIFRLGRTQ